MLLDNSCAIKYDLIRLILVKNKNNVLYKQAFKNTL